MPAQVEHQLGDVDRDAGNSAAGEAGQQVALELVAMRLERPQVALAAATLASKRASQRPATVSNRGRGERGTPRRP